MAQVHNLVTKDLCQEFETKHGTGVLRHKAISEPQALPNMGIRYSAWTRGCEQQDT
jgi:hypothetical protein